MTDNQDMKESLQEISRGLFLKLFDEDFNLTVSIGEAFDFTEKALLQFAEEQGKEVRERTIEQCIGIVLGHYYTSHFNRTPLELEVKMLSLLSNGEKWK